MKEKKTEILDTCNGLKKNHVKEEKKWKWEKMACPPISRVPSDWFAGL